MPSVTSRFSVLALAKIAHAISSHSATHSLNTQPVCVDIWALNGLQRIRKISYGHLATTSLRHTRSSTDKAAKSSKRERKPTAAIESKPALGVAVGNAHERAVVVEVLSGI
jgi:hypothetical protein